MGRTCRETTLNAMGPVLEELANADSLRIEVLVSASSDAELQQAQREHIAEEFKWLGKGISMGRDAIRDRRFE